MFFEILDKNGVVVSCCRATTFEKVEWLKSFLADENCRLKIITQTKYGKTMEILKQ